MPGYVSRLFVVAGLLLFGAPLTSAATPDPWPGLVQDIFNNRPMNDGSDVIGIEMPSRAEDAAIVPVTLRTKLSPSDVRQVLNITLVIDENPAPMAAKFQLGPDAKVSEISTRVRVNNYTDVHAVAELSDGKLYMVKTYVKASGGCSAPAAKNADEAQGRLGQMRYRQFAKAGEGPVSGAREAQVMIGHPNNSGLQMDQVTQPQYQVHLHVEWREKFSRRGKGYRGTRVPARMEDRRFRDLIRTACRPSETAHFRFGLSPPELVERACRLL
jgi:sulfur-oxidizing protein SoxY